MATDFTVGVEVGKDYARAAILPQVRARLGMPRVIGQAVQMKRFEDISAQEAAVVIIALVKDAVTKARQESPVSLAEQFRALGLALPDPIEPSTGAITYPTQHTKWRHANFSDLLAEQLTHDPYIVVDNDANMAAYGEYLLEKQTDAGRHRKHMVYIISSAGVGAGIIIDGRVYAGSHGFAGEFGHTIIDPNNEATCAGCEQHGCIDILASGTAIARYYARLGGKVEALSSAQSNQVDQITLARNGHFLSTDGRVVYGTAVLDAADRGGNPQAKQAVEQAAELLGVGLVSLYHILDPELIVLGGIPNQSDLYYRTAMNYVQFHLHPAIRSAHPNTVSRLKLDASLIGASLRAEDGWTNA